ncbi:MAG: large repetitive protein, partial [Bradyrhizobium sp.]|nr:large repetitive protein [Bradyrhizobium sp.]
GGTGTDTIQITDAAAIVDNSFSGVHGVEKLLLGDFVNSVTLANWASQEIQSTTGKMLTIDDTAATAGHGLTVDATSSFFSAASHLDILGGAGDDTVKLLNADFTSADTFALGDGSNTIQIVDAASVTDSDFTHVSGLDKLLLGDFNNSVTLGANATNAIGIGTLVIDGTAATGTHALTADASSLGAAAHVDILGGAGNDTLIGGAGDDTLSGGKGNDTLTGGAGANIFLFGEQGASNLDKILDFSNSQSDKIDISALLGSHATAADSNLSSYVNFAVSGNDLVLQVDVNGGSAFSGGTHDVATLAGYHVGNQHIVDVVFAGHDHNIAV